MYYTNFVTKTSYTLKLCLKNCICYKNFVTENTYTYNTIKNVPQKLHMLQIRTLNGDLLFLLVVKEKRHVHRMIRNRNISIFS